MRLLLLMLICCTYQLKAQQGAEFCASAKQKEAQRRAYKTGSVDEVSAMSAYDVKFHHLNINVERNTTLLNGDVRTIAVVTANQLDTFVQELHNQLTVDSVEWMNGQNASFIRGDHSIHVKLPQAYNKNEVIDLKVYYHGDAHVNASAAIGSGFSTGTSTRWNAQATWSLSQPYSAYEWFPCKQALQDKIDSVYIDVTTSSENKAGANGLLKRVVNLAGNKSRYEWRTYYPIDYYLISVAVAKYTDYSTYVHMGNDSMLIQHYIYDNPQTLTDLKDLLDQTAPLIEAFSAHFGAYPFWKEKYGHSLVPIGGGMEHQTMTSIGTLNFGVVAHELAHQWFGDHVTCGTWKDIWLNEGFATYSEYLALEWLNSAQAATEITSQQNYAMMYPGGSVWFTDTTNVNRIFDSRLTYNKGGAFIHTLRFELNNDSLFFSILRDYQQQFAFSTANTIDFKQLLEQKSGRDFTQVFNQWFYGEGYPTFNIRWNQLNDTVYIQCQQGVSSPTVTPLFITPFELTLQTTGLDTTIRLVQDKQENWYKIPTNRQVVAVTVDNANWLMNKSNVNKDITIVGVDEKMLLNSISAYPNPAKDVLHLSVTGSNQDVIVYDAMGRICMQQQLTNGLLNVSTLSPGVYMVSIKDNITNVILRFVKQ